MSSDRHKSRKSKPWQPLKRLMQALFRFLFRLTGRRTRQAGFVFPTTLLLVLMVLLTVSALTFRTFTRSTQVIAQREQQVIYNAATPAIDRAKAKLEFLFQEDDRFPSAPPNSDYLANMMLPPGSRIEDVAGENLDLLAGIDDPYTLPDETRLDVNDDGKLDNAWSFPADVNSDGATDADEIAVYSILVDHEADGVTLSAKANDAKADALVTRTGPLATTETIGNCPSPAVIEEGWQLVDTAASADIQKNFQITAFVANKNTANQAFESLEFQQSRISSRANKWGAWFRYDLDIFPGADFKWNGAMHTDGSLIVTDEIASYMNTSHNSCIYSDIASEITLGEVDENNDGTIDRANGDFQGQAIKGIMESNDFSGDNVEFHIFDGDGKKPKLGTFLTSDNDSVTGSGRPADIAMNPIKLFLEDKSEHINPSNWQRRGGWEDTEFVTKGRIINDETARPYVDDFFRADNRWGPKPRYNSTDEDLSLIQDPSTTADDFNVGDPIDPAFSKYETLTNAAVEGLDGYWERQAIRNGLRLIVGERLELGNANGWGNDPSGVAAANAAGDPMYPPQVAKTALTGNNNVGGDHQYRQHKTLRDNLAAVQSMVVYHYDFGGDFPAACMALAAHPGTEQAIINSRTFGSYTNGNLKADFLTGNGTNGWEFKFPAAFGDEGNFKDALQVGQPLGNAIRNLAYFAGDPNGGAPSFTPIQDGFVHPYPNMSMWGDFSVLRRIVDDLDAGGGYTEAKYDALSPADKSTLHSAACTLSLLAYNVKSDLEEAESTLNNAPAVLQNVSQQLGGSIADIMDCLEASNALGGVVTTPKKNSLLASLRSFVEANLTPSYSYGNSSLAMISNTQWLLAQNNGNGGGGGNNNGGGGGNNNGGGGGNNNGGGGGNNNGGGGGNACAGTGGFDVVTFLKNRGDLDATGNTIWSDPDTTVITAGNLCPTGADLVGFQSQCDSYEYFKDWTVQDWLSLIEEPGVIPSLDTADDDGDGIGNDVEAILEFANKITYYSSLIRDRDLGFREGQSDEAAVAFDTTAGSFVVWNGTTGLTEPVGGFLNGNDTAVFNIGCNPNIFQDVSAGGGGGKENNVALGLVSCAEIDEYPIKYPSLFYLFPLDDHDHDGSVAGGNQQPDGDDAGLGGGLPVTEQPAEEYVADAYLASTATGVNRGVTYRQVGADRIKGIEEIAAVPGNADLSDWVLPATGAKPALDDPDAANNAQAFRITAPNGNGIDVPFLDKGVFNGREQLAVRVLDIDIDALTKEKTSGTGDYWLPAKEDDPAVDTDFATEGIVYAFREDAVREDEIVRPATSNTTCDGKNGSNPVRFNIETVNDCKMFVRPGTNVQDPPLQGNKVSIKPVDFLPDPDRRPHGFRFKTASGDPADFSGGNPSNGRPYGMTFVTDNTTYIQGDFNLHSSTGKRGGFLEEFTYTLQDKDFDPGDFYDNRTADKLNFDSFADTSVDHWRPVEILSDSLTVLSKEFKDGAIENAFDPADITDSSYASMNRPQNAGPWLRENPEDPNDPSSPIWVDRNGTFYIDNAGTWDEYFDVLTGGGDFITMNEQSKRRSNLHNADDTYVNAVFVSGIVPERPNQSYGGLHNYPRFLESWNGDNLYISGSFIQLSFSTSATGPFDQDAWEPGDATLPGNAGEYIYYYRPPQRRWGFDVGLLYVPPAPAARRFNDIGRERSEYYREVAADDPYVDNLRCAEDGNGNQVFPNLCQ